MTMEEIYSRRFRPEFLERLLDFGLHGASDVYEDALILSQYLNAWEAKHPGRDVPRMQVIGCRRAGAGYFHEFAVSNVDLGIKEANCSDGNFILHEGSGGEHPPVRVDGSIVLVPADTDLELLADFPGLDTADLVILAHCQPESVDASRIKQTEAVLAGRNPSLPVARTFFEPEVVGEPKAIASLAGKRIAYLTTAPRIVEKRLAAALERSYGVRVARVGFSLTRDSQMRAEIDELMSLPQPPEAFLIEIKARGVEGARYIRDKYGIPVLYVNNIPRHVDSSGAPHPNNRILDRMIVDALDNAAARYNRRTGAAFPLCFR